MILRLARVTSGGRGPFVLAARRRRPHAATRAASSGCKEQPDCAFLDAVYLPSVLTTGPAGDASGRCRASSDRGRSAARRAKPPSATSAKTPTIAGSTRDLAEVADRVAVDDEATEAAETDVRRDGGGGDHLAGGRADAARRSAAAPSGTSTARSTCRPVMPMPRRRRGSSRSTRRCRRTVLARIGGMASTTSATITGQTRQRLRGGRRARRRRASAARAEVRQLMADGQRAAADVADHEADRQRDQRCDADAEQRSTGCARQQAREDAVGPRPVRALSRDRPRGSMSRHRAGPRPGGEDAPDQHDQQVEHDGEHDRERGSRPDLDRDVALEAVDEELAEAAGPIRRADADEADRWRPWRRAGRP